MKCVLCGAVKNVEKDLSKVLVNIINIETIFDEFVVVFYYDKSSDNTLELLNDFKELHSNINITIIINKEPLLQHRTHRIAKARNSMISFIREYHENTDYHIMMDMDTVCSFNINLECIKRHLALKTWDAISFNRSNLLNWGNYDIWALQYEPFIHHCHSYGGSFEICNIMRTDINKKLNNLNKENNELMECYSAFNGFAIYRTNKFLNVEYDGETQSYFHIDKHNEMLQHFKEQYNINAKIDYENKSNKHNMAYQNCEHIGFHIKAMRENDARIRISGHHIFDA
jgi:hypothetical protein